MKITLLYGTETGNAEMLAEDIGSELESDHDVECLNLTDFDPSDFDKSTFYIFVCSTYGDGDLPASAQPFGVALDATPVDLSGINFAIFGLGDSEYEETFNFGSQKLSDCLTKLGAEQVGERITHDASGPDMAEDLAFPWAQGVVALAEELA